MNKFYKTGLLDSLLSNPWVLIAPMLAFFIIFLVYPVLYAIFLSFYNWAGPGSIREYVGLNNFLELFADEIFRQSMFNTLKMLFASTIVHTFLGLFIAMFILSTGAFSKYFRAIFLAPLVIGELQVAILWNWIYDPSMGILNKVLTNLGLNSLTRVWLGDQSVALWSIFIAYTWGIIGIHIVIFLAGLQGIPESYYEAAELEGANLSQRLRFFILPSIKPQIFISLMFVMVFTLRLFPLVFVMTKGGPGRTTEVVGMSIYRFAFMFYRMGYSAALSVVVILIVLVTSTFYGLFLRTNIEEVQG